MAQCALNSFALLFHLAFLKVVLVSLKCEMCMNVGKLESYGPGSDCALIFPVCGTEWKKKLAPSVVHVYRTPAHDAKILFN